MEPNTDHTQETKKFRPIKGFYSYLLLVLLGIAFYMGLSHLSAVLTFVGKVTGVLSPFVAGIVLAYLLDFVVRFLEKNLLPGRRNLCILLSYILALIFIGVLLNLVLPQVAASFSTLVSNIPGYLDSFLAYAEEFMAANGQEDAGLVEQFVGSYQQLIERATSVVSSLFPQVISYGRALGSIVVQSFMAIIASIYMLMDKETLLRQMRKLVYVLMDKKRAELLLRVGRHANSVFGNFISGKILDSFIIGILCFLLTSILGIPYAVLVSVVIGLTNVIPFFGPFVGAIPCVLILLIVHPFSALEFGILILCLQQFDGNILGPKILGNSTGLSALWVLVAITVGGGLFGFPGMLIGVPTFAVIYSLLGDGMDLILKKKGIDCNGAPIEPAAQAGAEQEPLPAGQKPEPPTTE